MERISSRVSVNSPEFKRNREVMEAQVAQLRAAIERVRQGGPENARRRHVERGKLLVRELMEPRLPPGHLERPKSGFGLPLRSWLKGNPQLLEDAVRRLRERGVLQRSVNTEFRRAWYILVLDRWFTAFA